MTSSTNISLVAKDTVGNITGNTFCRTIGKSKSCVAVGASIVFTTLDTIGHVALSTGTSWSS